MSATKLPEEFSTQEVTYGGSTARLPKGVYQCALDAFDINKKQDANTYWARLKWTIIAPDTVTLAGQEITCAGRGFDMIQSMDPANPNGMGRLISFLKRMGIWDEVTNERGNLDPAKMVARLVGSVFECQLETVKDIPMTEVTEAERKAGVKPEPLKDGEGKTLELGYKVALFKGLDQVVREVKEQKADVPF